MNIPDKVKIGGFTYDVAMVDRLAKGEEYGAVIDYANITIEISTQCSKQRNEHDFLHEVVHAIFDNLGYTEQDEKQVDELAGSIYQLIIDNPLIFKEG